VAIAPKIITKPNEVKPPSVLLQGDVGTGKTDSILSFIDEGLEVFVLVTEPTGVDTLIDSARRREKITKIDYISKLHWHLVRPARLSMDMLLKQADQTQKKDASELQKTDSAMCNKRDFIQFTEMLQSIQNFTDDRTGVSYGDVTTWGDDRVFVLDSLSGLSFAVSKHVAGTRGTMRLEEYGICQELINNLVITMCGLNCFFVLTCHLAWEVDEISQKIRKMAATIGRRLAPQLPVHFSDCVLTMRMADGKFRWSTEETDTTTKWRSLPRSNNLEASFVPVVRAYNARKLYLKEPDTTQEK
jgi:hypothetical protein